MDNDSLNKAKKNAREYLDKVVRKTIDLIAQEDKSILSLPDDSSFPLRFEAFSYLAHKYKDLASDYSDKIRELWIKWIGINKTWESHKSPSFWPAWEDLVIDGYDEPYFEGYLGSGFLNNVSMFRAKEILNITGLEEYFDFRCLLNEYLAVEEVRNNCPNFQLWQLARIPTMFEWIIDGNQYVNIIPNLNIETDCLQKSSKNLNNEDEEIIKFLIEDIFFVLILRQASISLGNENGLLLRLLQYQKNNGSLFDNIFTTSLFLNSVHFLKLDPHNVIKEKGINWLINKQNTNGSWSDLKDVDRSVINTVFILESIDYITNDEALPIWAHKRKLEAREIEKESLNVRPFPVPEGTIWRDININFKSDSVVKLTVGDISEERDFAEMGFLDKRKNRGEDNYTLQWAVLISLARGGGKYSYNQLPIFKRPNLRQKIKRLNKTLSCIFRMNDKHPIACKNQTYQAKFKVYFKSVNKEDHNEERMILYNKHSIQDNEIKQAYLNDIQGKIEERKKKIMYADEKEIEGHQIKNIKEED